ncbi:MAG TPA: GNAT family N-acetyltransferase [Symbiobacteriaceae bacterium]|nr:GNAT family N-acetyltransferase [Symbiobacteriaceae bacterium]
MAFVLRPATEADAPRIAEILSAIDPDPVTPEEVINWERSFPRGGTQLRLVAVDGNDRAAGWAVASHSPYGRPGKFRQWVAIDPVMRMQGVGSLLTGATEQFAREHGATLLETDVRDSEHHSISFAEHRGFRQTEHLFESLLDLSTFDDARFAGVGESTGLRFFTMDEAPDLEAAERKLYALSAATVPDQPGYDGIAFPPFEDWRRRVISFTDTRLDCFWVAADGDRFVGHTRLAWRAPTRTMYTEFTGVLREYRGRHVALALKLQSVQSARRYGARFMRTNNSSRNGPMLAVNRNLGYQDQPGVFIMRKEL